MNKNDTERLIQEANENIERNRFSDAAQCHEKATTT